MSSNKQAVKRKTVKLKQPNPLFEKWLEEWKNEAAARNSDTQYAFAKALQTLKKYPLPLKTGKECLILENFGTRICLLLDRKLSEYRKTNPENDQNADSVEELPEQAQSPKPKKAKKLQKQATSPSKKKGKAYTPTLRSAPYAVLVALFEHLQKAGPPGEMTKGDLQKAAQPLCDTSMFKPLPGSYYSGWSCVGQLVSRGLVCRRGSPHRYSLTEEGIKLAEKLTLTDFEAPSTCELSPDKNPVKNVSSSPVKNRSETAHTLSPCTQINQRQGFLFEENPPTTSNFGKRKVNDKLTKKKNNSNQNSEELQTMSQDTYTPLPDSDPDIMFLTQESTSSQSNPTDEIIFLPGSFETILLVDTQEIHKGDELVAELAAQGARPEVRRLTVGDFAWVARDAAGAELLLPYLVERKRLDDLASSIKDGRFHEQKFRMKQSGVPHCMYLVESHGQRQYSLPTSTLLQAAANTEFVDRFSVKHTANSHETIVYLASFTKVISRKFADKTLIGCAKASLPEFNIGDECVSLMTFKEFNKLSSKTRKYSVREMLLKQLVQLRGLSVERAAAVVGRHPSPRSLAGALAVGGERLLADLSAGSLDRRIGPVISRTLHQLYTRPRLS